MRRSRGVTLFAWFIIVYSAFFFFLSLDAKPVFECFRSYPKWFAIALALYAIAAPLAGVIVGIGLLHLKEAARWAGLFVNFCNIMLGAPFFSFFFKDIALYVRQTIILELLKRSIYEGLNSAVAIAIKLVAAVFLFIFLSSIFFIYFFINPSVKRQFLRPEELS